MKRIRVLALITGLILGIGVGLSLFSSVRVLAANDDDLNSEPIISFAVRNSSSYDRFETFVKSVNEAVHSEASVFKTGNVKGSFLYLVKDGSKNVSIYVCQSAYNELKQAKKTAVMQAALSKIANTDNSVLEERNRRKLYNFLSGLDEGTSALLREIREDTEADFFSASYILRPFKGKLGTVLGIIALVLLSVLALTSLIDIAYIALPLVQNALEPKKDGKGGMKAKFVSKEAVNAVLEADKNPGHTALGYYVRSKSTQYICLGICLVYLCSGLIFDLVAGLVDYFQGITGD